MKHFQVNYDIVPSNGVIAEAQAFNVAALTGIWSLSGHSAFTSHFQTLNVNLPFVEVASAQVRFVGGSMIANGPVVSAQFVSLHYDALNNQVWENVGGLLTQRTQYSVDNLTADVTAQISSWSGSFQRQISVQLKGNGKLFQARLEVVYAISDSGADYSAAIAALQARVTALETGGISPSGPLTPEQVEQVLDEAAARVAGD